MSTTIDRIVSQLDKIADDVKKEVIGSLLTDLADFAADADAELKPGMLEAIEIIKENYGT